VHGLVALMEIQASRLRARNGGGRRADPAARPGSRRWDWTLINRGLAALERAEGLGARPGPYQLQAAIAACHARARRADETDWARIAELYDRLAAMAPSPVVELNRAVAYAMAYGPEAGLEIADQLIDEPTLKSYHLLPSVRGDFLFKLGRLGEAKAEFERAAEMTRNAREKALLLERAAESGRAG
jgi:predicted RNA polymerase sigma factor